MTRRPFRGTRAAFGSVVRRWGRDGPPLDWAWDLFPDAVDRLEPVLLGAMDTMPALGEVGFASVVNGPTIWAPDALPRCGRTKIPGYYDFNTLTYGIAHSMPLAERGRRAERNARRVAASASAPKPPAGTSARSCSTRSSPTT